MGSILGDIKEQLGLGADAEGFDPELILHINSVLADFNQLGIGPDAGFAIDDETATWEEFLGSDPRLNSAQSLAYLQVKMLFDPPQTGYVLTSMEKLIEQEQWRLTVKADTPGSSLSGGKTSIVGNLGDEHVIRLSDPPGGETLIDAGGTYSAEFNGKPVPLDLSELADGVLKLAIVVATGTYVIRRLIPRRTLLTVEVTAE